MIRSNYGKEFLVDLSLLSGYIEKIIVHQRVLKPKDRRFGQGLTITNHIMVIYYCC